MTQGKGGQNDNGHSASGESASKSLRPKLWLSGALLILVASFLLPNWVPLKPAAILSILVAFVMFCLVVITFFLPPAPPLLTTILTNLTTDCTGTVLESDDLRLPLMFSETNKFHAETDRNMWQVVSIYLPVSVGIIAWIISKISDASADRTMVLLAGSSGIILVGTATLFKHRLRSYNKFREQYLRERIESKMFGAGTEHYGLHTAMDKAFRNWASTSIHEVIDIYFLAYVMGVIVLGWTAKP